MTFHSFQYLVFLPVVVALHFALPHRFRWMLLLASSYLFYAAWRVDFLFLLILSTVTDYAVGLRMEAARTQNARRAILGASLLPLPWGRLVYSPEQEAYQLDISEEDLKKAPSFLADKDFDWGDRSQEEDLHRYYGVPPYWMGF